MSQLRWLWDSSRQGCRCKDNIQDRPSGGSCQPRGCFLLSLGDVAWSLFPGLPPWFDGAHLHNFLERWWSVRSYMSENVRVLNIWFVVWLCSGFLGGSDSKESASSAGDQGLWVWKIPGRRAQQPTPVFLPGESQGPCVSRHMIGYAAMADKCLKPQCVNDASCSLSPSPLLGAPLASSCSSPSHHLVAPGYPSRYADKLARDVPPRSDSCPCCWKSVGRKPSHGGAGAVRGRCRAVLRQGCWCASGPRWRRVSSWSWRLTSRFQCYHCVSCHLFPCRVCVIFFFPSLSGSFTISFYYHLNFKISPWCAWLLFIFLGVCTEHSMVFECVNCVLQFGEKFKIFFDNFFSPVHLLSFPD